MAAWPRYHRRVEAEIVAAFLVGAAAFVIAAVVGNAARSHVPAGLMGLLFIGGVLAVARFGGIVYAVPVGLVSLQAFDWYFLPPLRALDDATVFVLAVSILTAVLVAEIASRAGRRAAVSEEAREALADEQAALRRVATLVAHQSPATEVFTKVAEEVARLLGVDTTRIQRYDADGKITVVADWGNPDSAEQVGTRVALGGRNLSSLVHQTGQPARIDDYTEADGWLGSYARDLGVRSAVGSPIVVEGRLWGIVIAASQEAAPLPAGTELRIGEFTELVATAISNLQARSDLAASRARIVAATDEERRRVVRDLHDGAQQRLVHTVVTLKLARRALQRDEDRAAALVDEALEQAERATAEVRELAHGILPAVLTLGGLRAGVDALASRAPVPVENGVAVGRLPVPVEATAYFVVAEALTNVAKHAHAARATVTARVEHDTLRVDVRDDGVGGARIDGSGLLGLGDRLAVLDGRLRVESPAAGGTLVAVTIPLNGQAPRAGDAPPARDPDQ